MPSPEGVWQSHSWKPACSKCRGLAPTLAPLRLCLLAPLLATPSCRNLHGPHGTLTAVFQVSTCSFKMPVFVHISRLPPPPVPPLLGENKCKQATRTMLENLSREPQSLGQLPITNLNMKLKTDIKTPLYVTVIYEPAIVSASLSFLASAPMVYF